MSLFPAYTLEEGPSGVKNTSQKSDDWLTNQSFKADEIKILTEPKQNEECTLIDIDSDETVRKKHKKDKKLKKKKSKEKTVSKVVEPKLEFTGKEEYYVDKKSFKGYSDVDTLHRPSRPRYNYNSKVVLGRPAWYASSTSTGKIFRRYYVQKIKTDRLTDADRMSDETLFMLRTKEFNEQLYNHSDDIEKWLEFVDHQDTASFLKLSKTQVAEKKLEILDRGLKENERDETLLERYLEIVFAVFPSDEVSDRVEKLLTKHPTCLRLWEALISATQGSMTRCIVPDVLKIYERCMQTLYAKLGSDEVIMELFKKCARFLRQCGLYEQFFALIKVSLDLNVSNDKFRDLGPAENDQHTLVEFEEVVLKSGLPMAEIWLRVEKLRQNFYFLPCSETYTCSDPQRIIFTEDISNYIYPLSNIDNSFRLAIEILKLLKFPAINEIGNNANTKDWSEFDDVERLLAIFLHPNVDGTQKINDFDEIVFEFVKELNVGPTFVNNQIGCDIYSRSLSDILLRLSECFKEDPFKCKIFVVLWLRFERIRLVMERKATDTINATRFKVLKSQIKTYLKLEEFRNEILLFVEYAQLEYIASGRQACENILTATICQNGGKSDTIFAYISWIELLLSEREHEKTLKLLMMFALKIPFDTPNSLDDFEITEPKKLSALNRISEKVENLTFIEENVEIFELEQHFLPDFYLNIVKIRIYLLRLIKPATLEARDEVERLLRIFHRKNSRHNFLRKSFYEIYFSCCGQNFSHNLLIDAITEFPDNLIILRFTSMIEGKMWINLRSILTRNAASPIAIIFLIISMKFRYKQVDYNTKFPPFISSNIDLNETTIKNRINNLLHDVTAKRTKLCKNSLLWRLYLRSLFDLEENLEKCKHALYAALDECPWNKALYLDGAVYVPQEVAQLQDLIIEKQLRIYALPEELEILRDDKFE